jgi:hypothetical protein
LGGVVGLGGGMTQKMYAHVNKRIKKEKNVCLVCMMLWVYSRAPLNK